MNLFRRIDDLMFDRIFQPIVNRFPDAGPAGVARFFLAGEMVVSVALLGEHYANLCLSLLLTSFLYITADKPGTRLGLRNPRRIQEAHQLGRAVMCALTVVDLIVPLIYPSYHRALSCADTVLFLSFAYAVACDKLPPPRKQTVWERRRVAA